MEDKGKKKFEPKPWPSSPESIQLLEDMFKCAQETADKFHRQAQADLKDLHVPMDI